eukprot:scaffold2477_cov285-Chaetoceros_neogracile.AAC.7
MEIIGKGGGGQCRFLSSSNSRPVDEVFNQMQPTVILPILLNKIVLLRPLLKKPHLKPISSARGRLF